MPPYRERKAKKLFDHDIMSDLIERDIKEWLGWVIRKNPELLNGGYLITAGGAIHAYLTSVLRRYGIDYFRQAYKFFEDVYIDMDAIELSPMLNPWCIEVSWKQIITREEAGLKPRITGPKVPDIEKVIYNNPATIILWTDGTKTVVKKQEGDSYDPEKGLAMAIAKKALGNKSRDLNDVLHEWECDEVVYYINGSKK